MTNEALKLGLTRGDFDNHSVDTFKCLFENTNFTDVTLVCEDQRQIKSHKVILSSGSKFFREILLRNPHPNPLIYLKVPYNYLYSCVKFVYTGECEVEQQDIESFLESAKDLKIEGLTSETEKESDIEETKCNKSISDSNQEINKKENFDCDSIIKEEDMKYSITNLQNTFTCNECGHVEYCEASLKVHKRKKHSIQVKDIKEPYMSRTTQNDITTRTLKDRIRELNKFEGYVSIRTGKSLSEILASMDGKEVVNEMVYRYFLNYRMRDGKVPKFASLSMLRSSIKIQLIEAHGLDISNKEYFPEFKEKWLEIISELYADGMACKECGKQFEDIGSLRIHLENHSKESVISCKICGAEFSRKWRLKKHMITHTEANLGEHL